MVPVLGLSAVVAEVVPVPDMLEHAVKNEATAAAMISLFIFFPCTALGSGGLGRPD